jgi:hypothetical protein
MDALGAAPDDPETSATARRFAMTPAPPRPTDAPPFSWDEPAADETVPPADGMPAMSRRLLAIGGTAILALVVVGILSALV